MVGGRSLQCLSTIRPDPGLPTIHGWSRGAEYGPRQHKGRLRSVTTVLVLVIHGFVRGFVFVPPYLQNRRESRPSDSTASFRQQLSVLERTTPGSRSSNLARLDVGRYDIPRYDPRSNVSQLAHRSSGRPV